MLYVSVTGSGRGLAYKSVYKVVVSTLSDNISTLCFALGSKKLASVPSGGGGGAAPAASGSAPAGGAEAKEGKYRRLFSLW